LAGVLLFPLAFSGQPFSLAFSPVLGNAFGNAHWQSAIYALWDSVFAVGLCLGLITSFRTFFNQQGRLGQILSHHSYTVYIFHIPIIVCLALALKGVELTPLLKFAVASTLILPTCCAVAYIVRKTPFASKIL
jgi:surface polysaccharide O-acyltransferase-like enzyme